MPATTDVRAAQLRDLANAMTNAGGFGTVSYAIGGPTRSQLPVVAFHLAAPVVRRLHPPNRRRSKVILSLRPPALPQTRLRHAAALAISLGALVLPSPSFAASLPAHSVPVSISSPATLPFGGRGRGRVLAVTASARVQKRQPLAGVLKYRLEEFLTWSLTGQAVLLWSGVFVLLAVGGYLYQRETGFGAEKAYWRTWCALSGAEPDFSEDPWRAKVVVSLLTVVNLLFFAVLVGAVEGSMSAKIGELKGGRTQVYERGHEVILGWNSRLPRVLRQMAIAGMSNGERLRVVVLADEDKGMMDEKIKEFVSRGEFKGVSIINRSGDPSNPNDQKLVSIESAKKVLILSGGDGDGDDGDDPAVADSLAFKTALALKHSVAYHGGRRGRKSFTGVKTVVESRSARSDGMAGRLGSAFTQLLWPDLASRHIVKSALQPAGLVEVHRSLLDFDGHELYTKYFEELEDKDVASACEMLEGSVLVGIVRWYGNVVLNPRKTAVIGRGDEVVLLAENKESCRVTTPTGKSPLDTLMEPKKVRGIRAIPVQRRTVPSTDVLYVNAPRRNLVILGWRPGMSKVLDEIDGTVGEGSRVHIVAELPVDERHTELLRERYSVSSARNLKISHIVADPCDPKAIESALIRDGRGRRAPDAVLVLLNSSSRARNNRQRESRVLESLVSLRLEMESRDMKGTRVVAEVNSKETEELACADNPGFDAVSLDEFSALLLAQAAYEPQMLSTLQTLLSRDGAELALRPTSDFFAESEYSLSFGELVKRGRNRKETILGYISEVDGSVVFNPEKSSILNRSFMRHVIAIVDDIHAVAPTAAR